MGLKGDFYKPIVISSKDQQRTRDGVEIIASAMGHGRQSAVASNDNAGGRLRVGDKVEVKIEGAWWGGEISGLKSVAGRLRVGALLIRVRMDVGAPVSDAAVTSVTLGEFWRLSTLQVHHVPLTSQGVRNLNLAAPPRLRNGRHSRVHPMFRAICEHPEEMLARDGGGEEDDPISTVEEPIFADWDLRRKYPYEPEPEFEEPVAFEMWAPCLLCGAEKFLGERVNRERKVRADHGGKGDQYERAALRTS